jgi:NDP-sugar pyrophosphorylase family protein
MKALLICPWTRPAVPVFEEAGSLACAPLLGQGLIEYWLSHLACAAVKEVLILTDDQPEAIRSVVGDGARWGLKVGLVEEQRELTAAQALLKYEKELDPATAHNVIAVADHFPGVPELPVFESYQQWFVALKRWMPLAKTPDRVGVQEKSPGVQVGLNCRISPEAQLVGPCWIGKNVFIGPGATVGPDAIIEDGVFLEAGATVIGGAVGPDTFVGQLAEIKGSLAAGDTLVNLESGSTIKVPDRFLMCALREHRRAEKAGRLARLGEVYGKTEGHLLWKHLLLNTEEKS